MFPPLILRTAVCGAVLAIPGISVLELGAADHLPDAEYTKLETFLAAQGLPMPRGAGITVTQAEAYYSPNMEYLPWDFPDPSPGSLIGEVFDGMTLPTFHYFYQKVFTAQSSGDFNKSAHANTVGKFFYSNITAVADDFGSMAPDVLDVSCYYAVDYILGGYAASPVRKVQANAWIATGSSPLGGGQPTANTLLRDLDDDIDNAAGAGQGYLVVGGVNNLAGPHPELLASAYNCLAVGRSAGNQSTGGTPVTVDGAGRIKPEVVAPYTLTSTATGGVSSLAAMLYGAANDAGYTNAFDRNEIIKAVIMAGATKDEPEFYASPHTGWSRSLTAPIDDRFGAGEISAYESFRILSGGEQNAGRAIGPRGWDFATLPSGSPGQDYSFTIPPGLYATELSVVVTWNRFKKGNGPFAQYVVHDWNMSLLSAGGGVTWDRSESTIDNVEHIHYRNLPAGNYVIRLTRIDSDNSDGEYGIAWRIEVGEGARIAEADHDGGSGDVVLTLDNLDPLISYTIERASSLDPSNWMDVHTFSPAPPGLNTTTFEYSWTDTTATGPFQLYRLRWDPRTN